MLDGGTLGSRKHINLPGVRVNLPSITDKDKRDILFGIENDVDFIALSFVRNAEAVHEARKIIDDAGGHHAKLIAKIENQEGVDNFDEILEAADGIMVARGDLGVEIAFDGAAGDPAPDRAQVHARRQAGDRRHAPARVDDHEPDADARRGHGRGQRRLRAGRRDHAQRRDRDRASYPMRCVEVLDKIARRIEKEQGLGLRPASASRPTSARSWRARACRLADALNAPAIVVITRRGLLGQLVSSFRPQRAIIYAFTNMSTTRRKLWLSRSVVPFKMDFSSDPEKTVLAAFERLRQRNRVLPGDPIVVVSDVAAGEETRHRAAGPRLPLTAAGLRTGHWPHLIVPARDSQSLSSVGVSWRSSWRLLALRSGRTLVAKKRQEERQETPTDQRCEGSAGLPGWAYQLPRVISVWSGMIR